MGGPLPKGSLSLIPIGRIKNNLEENKGKIKNLRIRRPSNLLKKGGIEPS